MPDLLSHTALTARFKAGQSPLGHHWELFDADDAPAGRTRREYSGGVLKRGLWRTVTATGMDSGNDIRAKVLDPDGKEVVHLWSRNVNRGEDREPSVEVTDPDGQPIGVAHHPKDTGARLVDAGGALLATIPITDIKASPWELLDASGERIGVIDREAAKPVAGPSLLDYAVGINTITDNAADFAATMFRGFAFSNTYSVTLAELPPAGPLRTMSVLAPVLLGYLY
jgi:hypothetical protein